MMGAPRAALEASFEQLCTALPATAGVAVALPDSGETCSLGSWSTGVAWSTVKVPLAIAALRSNPRRAAAWVTKAITESDNAAAEQLWSQLGDPLDAAQQVQAVIGTAGDECTRVESRRLRRGFTAFGQTPWRLDRQALFAAGLPGVADASPVIDLMRQLTERHRWGLAAKGVAAKGGWGPGQDGDYLVRQFGIVPTGSGHLGVALAAQAASFQTGVKALNRIADWLLGGSAKLSPLTGGGG
ncbi:hypothetical protein [Mycobacterium ulcerans]|uniref:Beta-lactamase enzyme family protein n=1 Tax=Mycobacterium ulcerans subsp. shinshuense TaxID=1124626 RepID=A0A1B4XYE6_MYCUL|nr:hypothetical protein [Mycobacterium ulcerans]BAV39819.1 hypothetical protein SHTP_0438 [Mycobacterium ulcerans subsp. shinshuense]